MSHSSSSRNKNVLDERIRLGETCTEALEFWLVLELTPLQKNVGISISSLLIFRLFWDHYNCWLGINFVYRGYVRTYDIYSNWMGMTVMNIWSRPSNSKFRPFWSSLTMHILSLQTVWITPHCLDCQDTLDRRYLQLFWLREIRTGIFTLELGITVESSLFLHANGDSYVRHDTVPGLMRQRSRVIPFTISMTPLTEVRSILFASVWISIIQHRDERVAIPMENIVIPQLSL